MINCIIKNYIKINRNQNIFNTPFYSPLVLLDGGLTAQLLSYYATNSQNRNFNNITTNNRSVTQNSTNADIANGNQRTLPNHILQAQNRRNTLNAIKQKLPNGFKPTINKILYGLEYDKESDMLYGADARDYQKNGFVYRYTSAAPVDSFETGIVPGNFKFR